MDLTVYNALLTLYNNPEDRKDRNVNHLLKQILNVEKNFITDEKLQSFQSNEQGDADEFIDTLFHSLTESTKCNVYEDMFSSVVKTTRICLTCNKPTYRFELYPVLSLILLSQEKSSMNSINEMLKSSSFN